MTSHTRRTRRRLALAWASACGALVTALVLLPDATYLLNILWSVQIAVFALWAASWFVSAVTIIKGGIVDRKTSAYSKGAQI